MLLSDALLRYSKDVRTGRVDFSSLDRQWHLDPPQFDSVDFVDDLTRQPDPARQLATLPPPHEGYRHLAAALENLKRKRQEGLSWPQIPVGPLLEIGDRHTSGAASSKVAR